MGEVDDLFSIYANFSKFSENSSNYGAAKRHISVLCQFVEYCVSSENADNCSVIGIHVVQKITIVCNVKSSRWAFYGVESGFWVIYRRRESDGYLVYGHFGPWTFRTQDSSALVPKCPLDISAPS